MKETSRKRIDLHPMIWLAPAILLVVALLPLPYGYYTLLRIVVASISIVMLLQEYRIGDAVNGWSVVFTGTAILFNPLIPIHLTRAIWAPLDIAMAVLLIVHMTNRGPGLRISQAARNKG